MHTSLRPIDHSALRTNQALIIILTILAFVLNLPWLVVLVAVVMLTGTLIGQPGFGFFYRYVLKPAGWLKADVLPDNPEPHRFAQGLGGVFLAASSITLFAGAAAVGWSLAWLVVALAALNLFGGFCVGCAVYYWLNRLGLPGFSKSPPEGTFPGTRPKVKA
jgi:hypothetical protein